MNPILDIRYLLRFESDYMTRGVPDQIAKRVFEVYCP
jgi:hypothetical protein